MTPKQVKDVQDPSVAWAEKLWERLESGLLDVQNTIIAIIDAKAWEPLGYESFSKAWVDKIMSKITIASELRPHVVYQMFDEGLTADQIADAVKGITPETARNLKRQKGHGVPPDQATTTVRQHRRKLPGQWSYLHLKVENETLVEWKRRAEASGRTVNEIALAAVTLVFDELA
jgi:hypothetical protein